MKLIYYTFLTLSLFAASCGPSTQDSSTLEEKKIIEIEGFSLPEGACSDGEFIYISNVGVNFKPLDKDGDGFISKVNREGKIEILKFLPTEGTLHSPKGMGIIGKTLYVTDIDHVYGFDLNTRQKVFDLSFENEKTQLLNDIAVKDSMTLFVSAMDIGKVFEVNVQDKGSYLAIIEAPQANGLCWWDNKLYLGQFGREAKTDTKFGHLTRFVYSKNVWNQEPLAGYRGNIDGVELDRDSVHIYFTDWKAKGEKGTLKVMDIKTGEIREVNHELVIDGPGDIYLDRQTRKIWLPKMKENKLLLISLE